MFTFGQRVVKKDCERFALVPVLTSPQSRNSYFFQDAKLIHSQENQKPKTLKGILFNRGFSGYGGFQRYGTSLFDPDYHEASAALVYRLCSFTLLYRKTRSCYTNTDSYLALKSLNPKL